MMRRRVVGTVSTARALASAAYSAAAKPALTTAGDKTTTTTRNGLFGSVFGSSGAAVKFPPMSETFAHAEKGGNSSSDVVNNAPTTSATVLPNGATIASENAPGATTAVGLYADVGSERERGAWEGGFTHALERAAFKATKHRSAFRVTRECEVIGANLSASASREQFAYAVDALKSHLPRAVELLLDSALNPALENHEVEAVVKAMKDEVKELNENPQALLMEATHATAYSGGLGNALVAPSGDLSHITGDALREFVRDNFTAPRVVLAAAGCDHDELVRIAEPMLAALPSGDGAPATPTTYVGGDFRQKTDSPITSVVLGFEFKGGWRDVKASTAMTVLTMLLGGGGSFSAGGPGKGMYSRLYTRVLNKYSWAQNCTAFHSIFNDTGIVGISAMANSGHVGDMVKVMAGELQAVAANGGVSAQELERAKNATVSSILMNLESKAVIAEDIGRQMLTYKHRKSAADFIADVRAVTAADVAKAAADLIASNPTVAMSGELHAAPRYEEIKAMF
jgi:processing peptidase subunit alpha